ncbi:hypothetical protein GCM10020258_18170 [Sphingomonas yabuuchiae]
MLALYPLAAGSLWTILPIVFAIGLGGALGTVLQTRLMDVAGEGQGSPPRSTIRRSTRPMPSAPGRVGWPSPTGWDGPRPAMSDAGWRWAGS